MNTEMTDTSRTAGQPANATENAGLMQLAGAVFWSFFGVRKHKNYQEDAARLTMLQAVVGGLVGGILLVLSLVALVHVIVH